MTTRRLAIVVLILVLGASRAEDTARGNPKGEKTPAASKVELTRGAFARRFLAGFWVTAPTEESTSEVSPGLATCDPALVPVPSAPPAAPALQLFAIPSPACWLLPRWCWYAAAAMLVIATGVAFAGVLRNAWQALRNPGRSRRLAAVQELHAWCKKTAVPIADLLQSFRQFYDLPAGCDADAIAAAVGATDAELAQAILTMDRQRFAPGGVAAEEANTSTAAGVGRPVGAVLSLWLRHQQPKRLSSAAVTLVLTSTAAMVLLLVVVIASAKVFTQQDAAGLAWNCARQRAAEKKYDWAFDSFLALARVSTSSPELSRNVAMLAAATGRKEHAQSWCRHACIQEQLRGATCLGGRDRHCLITIAALLFVTACVGVFIAAMAWPGAWCRVLAWRAWLSLLFLLFVGCVLLLFGHWQSCHRLSDLAVVAMAQPLSATSGAVVVTEQAPGAMLDRRQTRTTDGNSVVVSAPTFVEQPAVSPATYSLTALAQLAAGDCVVVLHRRGEWSFVSVQGRVGWLPSSGMLPFRLSSHGMPWGY